MENGNGTEAATASDDTAIRASLLEFDDDGSEASEAAEAPIVVTEGVAVVGAGAKGTGAKRLVNLTAEVEAARRSVLQNLRLGGNDGWLLTSTSLPATVDRLAIHAAWTAAGLPAVLAPPAATAKALFRAAVVATAPRGAIVKSTRRGRVLTVASGEAATIGGERGFLALYDVALENGQISVIPGSYAADRCPTIEAIGAAMEAARYSRTGLDLWWSRALRAAGAMPHGVAQWLPDRETADKILSVYLAACGREDNDTHRRQIALSVGLENAASLVNSATSALYVRAFVEAQNLLDGGFAKPLKRNNCVERILEAVAEVEGMERAFGGALDFSAAYADAATMIAKVRALPTSDETGQRSAALEID